MVVHHPGMGHREHERPQTPDAARDRLDARQDGKKNVLCDSFGIRDAFRRQVAEHLAGKGLVDGAEQFSFLAAKGQQCCIGQGVGH
jgi:hypothetical protein